MRLNHKVAIVTGAASGFGAAIAERFAKEGAQVLASDIDADAGEALASRLRAEGNSILFQQADVTDENAMRVLADAAEVAFGTIDILINNAGVPQFRAPFEDAPLDDFDKIMAVNVKSIFVASMAVLPVMKKHQRGVIINTVSTSALRPRPQLPIYNASKGAALILTQSMAIELAASGIRVNAICPGGAETPMLQNFLGGNEDAKRQAFMAVIPMGRLCSPIDVANAMLFLASDEAQYITGIALPVDGGRCI